MDSHRRRWSLERTVVVGAIALGVAAGSYGVASAASGSSSSSSSPAAAAPGARQPWGPQRSDETPLTGDALARVRTAALAKVGANATVVRVETDADGHAAYEAHILKSDGTPETVYVDGSYAVVSVESR